MTRQEKQKLVKEIADIMASEKVTQFGGVVQYEYRPTPAQEAIDNNEDLFPGDENKH